MSKAKWIMKQYWRVGTIRALLSLALGMFVLGRQYYKYIPALEVLGVVGALILGTFLVILFLGIGWAYDEKGKFWSPKVQVVAERSPYQFVSNYHTLSFDYPALYAVFASLKKTFERIGMDTSSLDNMSLYLDGWFRRGVSRSDIFEAEPESVKFSSHRFGEHLEKRRKKIPIGARLKLGFETELLRLNWIQALTGLFQDVLVFGALYVTIIFPTVVVDGFVPLPYLMVGILFLSMPLYLCLTAAGWYYDKKLRVWSVDYAVKVERNPFSYVPDPRNGIIEIPFFLALFKPLNTLFKKMELDNSELEKIIEYLETYREFSAADDQDMAIARTLRKNLDVRWS